MNLLMYYNNVDTRIFEKRRMLLILKFLVKFLPLSAKFANSLFEDGENTKTSNNIVEIRNGKYLRGHMNKGVLGSGSKGLIKSI